MARGLHAGFRLGDFRITPARCELAGPDGIRSVHPRAMEVLLCLAEHAGALVARETLREKVWGGAAVTEETLTRSIGELRHELGDSPERPRYIQTVPRRGYRLIAPVIALEDAPRPPSTPPVQRLIGELKRRKVFRVTAAYAVVAWLLLQVADVTLDALPVPEGSMTLLVILAAMGFPIAIVLAWALEITDQGVELDPVTASRWPRLAGLWRYLIGGLVLAGIAGVTAFLVTRPAPIVDSRYPIAVLPFDDLTPAADNAFCDGLTEELTNYLAKIRELRVASRTSTTALKMLGLPIPEIAERLKVNYVLEGSCRSEDDALRVTAQLIQAAEDFHLWTEAYGVTATQLFDVQQDIARNVALKLKIVLSSDTEKRLDQLPTTNADAYVRYLGGRSYLRGAREAQQLDAAEKLFLQAIELDKDFAEAHAGLCETYLAWYELERAVERYDQAERACLEALANEEETAQVYVALGDLYRTAGEYERAHDAFTRAATRDPMLADAQIGAARSLAGLGRDVEAEADFRRAIELDPGYWFAYNTYGGYLFAHGRFEEAAKAFGEVVKLTPNNAMGFNNLGSAYFLEGRFHEASEAWEQSRALAPRPSTYANLGSAYFYKGDFALAEELYQTAVNIAPEDHRLWGSLADAQAVLGQSTEARQSYARAIELAEARLELNPKDDESKSRLSHYLAAIGEEERARRLIMEATNAAPENMWVQYDATLVYARLGQREAALTAAQKAVDLGYRPVLLKAEPILQRFAGDEGFEALLAQSGKQNE